jgi:CRISPR/Cas system-associated exonuclease Cas4 (RecB family)
MTLTAVIGWVGANIAVLASAGFVVASVGLIWARLGARIFCREKAFKIYSPIALYGRPDLVMQNWGGELVVHDLKTRKTSKVYESDRLQLNLYAYLIGVATGRKVAKHAVVRVASKSGVVLIKIDLTMSAEAICMLAERYRQTVDNPRIASLTSLPWLCKNCGFNGRDCSGVKYRR